MQGATILDMKPGQKAKVKAFKSRQIESDFLSFGLLPGSVLELRRKAPFGGSLYIILESHIMAIRRREAIEVIIELL